MKFAAKFLKFLLSLHDRVHRRHKKPQLVYHETSSYNYGVRSTFRGMLMMFSTPYTHHHSVMRWIGRRKRLELHFDSFSNKLEIQSESGNFPPLTYMKKGEPVRGLRIIVDDFDYTEFLAESCQGLAVIYIFNGDMGNTHFGKGPYVSVHFEFYNADDAMLHKLVQA